MSDVRNLSGLIDEFTEDNVRKMLYNSLCENFPNDLVVEKWTGWSFRIGKKRRERHRFLREFDIALFSRGKREFILRRPIMEILKPPYYLTLIGIEIKGLTKEKVKMKPPGFAEGVDQALVLLHQGADYAYLVTPESKNDKELKLFCDNFASKIGLILVRKDGTFEPHRDADRNYSTTSDDLKKKLLTSLISGGNFSNIRIPKWCKKHEY